MRRSVAHLTPAEIDVLVRSRSSGTGDAGPVEGDRAEAFEHLATCAICQSTMDMHIQEQDRLAHLRGGAQADRGPECPPDSIWPRVAAELLKETEAQALIGHAAACDHCGPLLRANVADFADELTPDEEMFLRNLESSRPGWQRRLASEMCESRSHANVLAWLRQHLWPFNNIPSWAYAGLVAALALVTIFVIRSLRQTPLENLIATAYTEQRTLELRIPNATHAPVRRTRGSMNGSRLDRPLALLEGEARIAQELQQHSAGPALLQAMGRCDLLDWKYDAAIHSFRQALDLAPATPELMTDLASAYFESAEANQHRTSDYAAARDLLDQALRFTPDDLVALFNRAIVYERMDMRGKAIEDWRHYLRVDRNSEWSSEARTRLSKLEQSDTNIH